MLDEALLRPGRLEVHVEIGLPDEAGRVQILNIHTAGMRSNGFLVRPRPEMHTHAYGCKQACICICACTRAQDTRAHTK